MEWLIATGVGLFTLGFVKMLKKVGSYLKSSDRLKSINLKSGNAEFYPPNASPVWL